MKTLLKLFLAGAGIVVLGVVALTVFAFFKGNPASMDEKLQSLDSTERAAYQEILQEAGIPASEIRLVGLAGIQHNARSLSIENGHVDGIRLEKAKLPSLKPFSRFPALQMLCLAENEIESTVGLVAGNQLQMLDLARNSIKSLKGMPACASLKKLNLSGNPLTSLQGLEVLGNLEIIDLSNCQLTTVQHLQHLGSLKELVLDYNRLTSLEGVELAMHSLERLSVSHNQLSHFPASLLSVSTLSSVDLSFNQIRDLPRRPAFKPGFTMSVDGNPPPEKPENWISELPKAGGDKPRLERTGDHSTFMPSGAFHEQFLETVSGTGLLRIVDESNIQSRYLNTLFDVEVTVKKGRVRVYLGWDTKSDGYVYAEAGTGTSGMATGYIWDLADGKAHSGYYLDVIEGPAEGVCVRLKLANEPSLR